MLEHRLNLIPSFIKKLRAAKVVIRHYHYPAGESPVCMRERSDSEERQRRRERWKKGGRAVCGISFSATSLSLSLFPSSLPNSREERTSLVVEISEITILNTPARRVDRFLFRGDERSPLLDSELCDLNHHFGVGNGRPPLLRRQRRLPRFEGVCRQQHVHHRQSQRSREDMFRRCLSIG